MSIASGRSRPTLLLVAIAVVAGGCGRQTSPAPEPERTEAVMTRAAFRERVGVACNTPDLLPVAFRMLPIGFYKDYHALGSAHLGAEWASGLGDGQRYLPVIQYRSIGDTPEVLDLLRLAARTGQFPVPAGVEVDDLLAQLERSRLEAWLVERTRDGTMPEPTLFMLGNEPGYHPNHDLRTPAQIVEDARIVKDMFTRHGLNHRLALGGMSTPNNAYNRQAYGMPPLAFLTEILEEAERRAVTFDAFVIHPYPFDGIDDVAGAGDGFDPSGATRNTIGQVHAVRSLMRRHGQRDKDLIVGELGVPISGGTDHGAKVRAYADEILTWCLTATDPELGHPGDGGRMVQRFTWFLLAVPAEPTPGITDDPVFDFEPSVLLEPGGTLTALGRTINAVADRLAPVR